MTEDRDSFGPRLRRERELRGLTITAIAQSTKIKASLFAALERNDVSQWPAGIFRRSFIREYASALGMPAEPLVAEFLRLFPEPGRTAERLDAAGGEVGSENLRLTLADDRRWRLTPGVMRVLAAVLDACAILLVAASISKFAAGYFWIASSAVTLGYFTVATACLGRSVASYLLGLEKLSRSRTPREPRTKASLNPRDFVDLIAANAPSEALRSQ